MAAALQAFIQEIDGTIAQSSRERRGAMLRHLTDFFLVGADQYSDGEIALIDDIYVRLIEAIEESARALLAMRLAPLPKAPPKILRILAHDNAIDVASPILVQSEQLDDESLIDCAKHKSQEHLFAISRRRMLAERLTDILVTRGDRHVVLSTVGNTGAKFSNKGFTLLVNRSRGDDRLTLSVGTRPDVPQYIFRQLLEVASKAVRLKLESESPAAKREIRCVVDDVANQILARVGNETPRFAAAQVLVNSLYAAGQLTASKLQAFAEAEQVEDVIAALSLLSDMSLDFVERALEDERTETLLILCKTIELPWDVTRAITMLGGAMRRRSVAAIANDSAAFERLRRDAARQILDFHRALGRAKSALS